MVNFLQKLIKKTHKLGADPIPAGDNSIKDKSKKIVLSNDKEDELKSFSWKHFN